MRGCNGKLNVRSIIRKWGSAQTGFCLARVPEKRVTKILTGRFQVCGARGALREPFPGCRRHSPMMRTWLLWMTCLAPLAFGGCAIYTPFETKRYWVDYNTERQHNAQIEIFDHLPPKTVRVKMYQWGYNIGPAPTSGVSTWGKIKAAILPRHGESYGAPAGETVWVEAVPSDPMPVTPDVTLPPIPPAAPPVENPAIPPGVLPGAPSAARPALIAPAGYQSAGTTGQQASPASATWLFAPTRPAAGQPPRSKR